MSVSLKQMAASWRKEESTDPLETRHEYDSQANLFSEPPLITQVGQVGQVGQLRDSNDLSEVRPTHSGGSGGGSDGSAHEGDALKSEETPFRAIPQLPGVPGEWIAGVYRLQRMPPFGEIETRRWVRFRYDALRLLHEHGALIHAAGWDALDVFGLHRDAPDRRTDGMGLAWLMREMTIAQITPKHVTVQTRNGVVQTAFRRGAQLKREMIEAWRLAYSPLASPSPRPL